MTRDADAALAASGTRMERSMKRVTEQQARTRMMRWLLRNNHFAEAFRVELEGGSDGPRR